MTTQPTPSEVERVEHIHGWLDQAAQDPTCLNHGFTLVDKSGAAHEYTAYEVRRWPEVKAALIRDCRDYPNYHSAWNGSGASLFLIEALGPGKGDNLCAEPVARGLCLYQQMLAAMLPAPAQPEPPSKADAKAPDPYRSPLHCQSAGYTDAEVRQLTDMRPKQEAARARLIAALAAEMSEPLSKRRAALEKRFGPRPCDDWRKGWEDEP